MKEVLSTGVKKELWEEKEKGNERRGRGRKGKGGNG